MSDRTREVSPHQYQFQHNNTNSSHRNEKPTLWVKLRVLRYTSEEAAPFFPSLPLVLRRTGLKRRGRGKKAAAEEIGLALEAAR